MNEHKFNCFYQTLTNKNGINRCQREQSVSEKLCAFSMGLNETKQKKNMYWILFFKKYKKKITREKWRMKEIHIEKKIRMWGVQSSYSQHLFQQVKRKNKIKT